MFFKSEGIKKGLGKIQSLKPSSGGQTRTDDLWVMSPTSYQLLHPAIYFLEIICLNHLPFGEKISFDSIKAQT